MLILQNIKKIKFNKLLILGIVSLFFVFACKTRVSTSTNIEANEKQAGIEDKNRNLKKAKVRKRRAGIDSIENLKKTLDDLEKKANELNEREQKLAEKEKDKLEKLKKDKEDIENQKKEIEDKITKLEEEEKTKKTEDESSTKTEIEPSKKEEKTKQEDLSKDIPKDINVDKKDLKKAHEKFELITAKVTKDIKSKGGFEQTHRLKKEDLTNLIKSFQTLNQDFLNIKNKILEKDLTKRADSAFKDIKKKLVMLMLDLNIMRKRPKISNTPFEALSLSLQALKAEEILIKETKENKSTVIGKFKKHLNLHLQLLRSFKELKPSDVYIKGHLSPGKVFDTKEKLKNDFIENYSISKTDIPGVQDKINDLNKEIEEIINIKTPKLDTHDAYQSIIEDFNRLEFNEALSNEMKMFKESLPFMKYHPLHTLYLSKELFKKMLKEFIKIDSQKTLELKKKNSAEDRVLFDRLMKHEYLHKKLLKELNEANSTILYTYLHLDRKKNILDDGVLLSKPPSKIGLKITTAILNRDYLNRIINETLDKEQKEKIEKENGEINNYIDELSSNLTKFDDHLKTKAKEQKIKDEKITEIRNEKERRDKLEEENNKAKLEKQKAEETLEKTKAEKKKKEIEHKEKEEKMKQQHDSIQDQLKSCKETTEHYKILLKKKEALQKKVETHEKITDLKDEIKKLEDKIDNMSCSSKEKESDSEDKTSEEENDEEKSMSESSEDAEQIEGF